MQKKKKEKKNYERVASQSYEYDSEQNKINNNMEVSWERERYGGMTEKIIINENNLNKLFLEWGSVQCKIYIRRCTTKNILRREWGTE